MKLDLGRKRPPRMPQVRPRFTGPKAQQSLTLNFTQVCHMNKLVQTASVLALAIASASASAYWGGAPCLTEEQQKAMAEQQQAAAKQYQAQFQAMAEQRAKAMEEMMKAQGTQGPGFAPMDPFYGQGRPMRDFPAMPERPRFGEMPQMPDFPAMPEAPKFGEMPAMPEMPEMPAGFERVPPVLGHRGQELEAYRAQRMEEAKARHDQAMTQREARRQGLAQRVNARRYGPQPMWLGPVEAPVAPAAAQPAAPVEATTAPAATAPAAPTTPAPGAN